MTKSIGSQSENGQAAPFWADLGTVPEQGPQPLSPALACLGWGCHQALVVTRKRQEWKGPERRQSAVLYLFLIPNWMSLYIVCKAHTDYCLGF